MQRLTLLAVKGGILVNTNGQTSTTIVEGSFPGSTVSVFNTGTTNLATIYGDNLNPPTPKSNPFTADANGFAFFYAPNGSRVDVQLSGTGITVPFVVAGDVLVDDLTSLPVITPPQTVAFSPTPVYDLATANWFVTTLTGNVSAPTFPNAVAGSVVLLTLIQDGTGGRTFTWPASFLRPPSIASAANATTELTFKFDGTNWRAFAATGDNLQVPGNALVTGTLGVTGNQTNSGSLAPNVNAISQLGIINKGWKDVIAAGTPWFDIRAYGGVGDGTTDCLAAFNAAIAAVNANSGGVIYFPRGQWRMSAKPNSIGVGAWVEGEGSGSTTGFGTFIIADYNEVTATNGFLTWDGSFVVAGGTGGGIRNCTIYKNTSKTGGTAIKLTGADDNHRAGFWRSEHVVVTGAQSPAGTWSHAFRVDGQNNSTSGTQGIRDIVLIDFWCCNTTVTDQTVVLNNAAKCDWYGGEVFAAAGTNPGLTVTGTGGVSPSTLNSTEIIISITLSGNVVLDQCNNVIILPDHATGNLTITANAANSIFWGRVEGTVSNLGATNNCAVINAGNNGNLVLNQSGAIGATADGTVASSTAGAVFSRTAGTLGQYFFGDGNAFINRTGTNAFNANFGNNATFTFAGTGTAIVVPILTLSGLINKYNNITTAGNGVASVYGATSQKAETTADANVLTFTPPAAVGSYRLRFVMSVASATAAILGWTATWTDSNGNAQTPTNLSLTQIGTAGPALTFTAAAAGNYYGQADIDINAAGANIVIKFTLASGTITAKASATIERLQ